MQKFKTVFVTALLVAALCFTPYPVQATSVVGSSSVSAPDQWAVGLEVNLTAQADPPFQQTFNFSNSVLTKNLQFSYRRKACTGVVLFDVVLPDGSLLFRPITIRTNVDSDVAEFSVDSKTINSLTVVYCVLWYWQF